MDGMKCAHEQCTCAVDLGETYCGDWCRRVGEGDLGEPHGRCGCKHTACSSP